MMPRVFPRKSFIRFFGEGIQTSGLCPFDYPKLFFKIFGRQLGIGQLVRKEGDLNVFICLERTMEYRLTLRTEGRVVVVVLGVFTKKLVPLRSNLAFEDIDPEGVTKSLWEVVKFVSTQEHETMLNFARRILEDPELGQLERFAIIEPKYSPPGPKEMAVLVPLPDEGASAS